jgi:CheY-like chemotaxis protein
MEEKNVLIIDDEKDVREMLSDIYQAEGFATETAGDLKTAQRIINQKQFAVISSDDNLPRGGERVGDAYVSHGTGNFVFEINDFVRDIYRSKKWALPVLVAYTSRNIEDGNKFFDAVFVKPDISQYQKFLKELK